MGDRVIAINGQKLLDETLQQAYKLIQEGDDEVELEVEYDVQGRGEGKGRERKGKRKGGAGGREEKGDY